MTRLIERIEAKIKNLKFNRREAVLQQGPDTRVEDRAVWQALASTATLTPTTVAALERAVDRRFSISRDRNNT